MVIKHLVISGGGPTGIKSLGSLKYLNEKGFWSLENIESIYATSAGSLLSVLILLKFDFETISNYIINRPWHEVYKLHLADIYNAFARKGFLDEKSVEVFFKPFFDAKDINMDITMEEFHRHSGVDFHVFSFEINEFKTIDISHKTHPQLLLKTAIKMSISIPIVFTPICIDNKCYIDGGIRCNYPLLNCLAGESVIESEVLGVRNIYTENKTIVNDESNIVDFVLKFINKLVFFLDTEKKQTSIQNEIVHDICSDTVSLFTSALKSSEFREELMKTGEKSAEEFYGKAVVKNCNKLSVVTLAS